VYSYIINFYKMKNQISQVSSFEWEINETQDQQKKKASFLEKIITAVLVLLFIFPPLGFFALLIIIIIFINSLQNSNIKQKENIILEKYKIDENGIAIDNLKENKKSFFSWNELSSFYSYSKINPVMGFIISKIAGDDFVIVNKNNEHVKLRVGVNDALRVRNMISGKLKFKAPTRKQAASSLSNSPFKIKYSGTGLGNWINTSLVSNNKQNNIGFVNSKQEKQFHEQTIAQKHNLQKEKEALKQKILIISYIVIMFIVTIIYLIFDKN